MQIFTWDELCQFRKARSEQEIPLEDLFAMVERCRKATPGGWGVYIERGPFTIGGPVCYMDENRQMVVGTPGDWGPTAPPQDDAEFIACARSDLPRLLVEVLRRRGMQPPDLDALGCGM
jgi:hypothetical protein